MRYCIATTPLWIWTVGRFSPQATTGEWPSLPSQHRLPLLPQLIVFELCVAVNAVAHLLGLLLRYWRSGVADAFLAWFTRPFVLFYALVFSTLGVYINIYAFGICALPQLGVVAFGPPVMGYLCGGLLSVVARLPLAVDRIHVAVESSILNGPLAATMIRLGVPSDVDADAFAATAMLVSCATPMTLVGASLARRLFLSVCGRMIDEGRRMSADQRDDSGNVRSGRVTPKKDFDELSMTAERNMISKSRSQITQADELEISVIVVDEKVTVM